MADPKIADRRPAVLDLDPATYHWCACGSSKKGPFCDGSHKGSTFAPKAFTLPAKTKVALCQCKHSKNGHLCDGSHKHLPPV
ncbi:MAG: CDGSH iron-sulfur domain-containing protein [Planctomycetes bacterium]|nr:CDGSH iron-sulfur domain-containing protein [Planctomycetota bacterium]